MATSSVCWGIELGAGAVKAMKLARDGEKLNVLEFAVIPHKRVLSTPELDQAEATRLALGALISQYDLSGAPIAVSVPGHSAFARFAKLPPVEPKKIPDIVKFEAVQQIPFPIDEVEWDYQTFQSPDSPDVEVGIFAITRQRVMEKLAMWADVGITPEFLTLGPLSVFNAMSWDLQFTEQTPGTVILDVGTTSTDLIVAEAGRVWIRTFQLGGHNFTEALANTFKLKYPSAEKLKREAEQSKHARHVFQAMRPVFGDLAQEVQRSIGYYQSLHRDANLTRMIVFGSTFNLPGLRKYLGQQLQMEVVRLDHFRRLSIEGPAAGEFSAATLNMATAYGLALQGLGLETISANLMPKPVVREATWRRKTKWFVAAAALGLAAGGACFVRPLLEQVGLQSNPMSDRIGGVTQELNTEKAEWTQVSSQFTPDFRAANALMLFDNRDIYPHIANDVGLILRDSDEKAGEGSRSFRFSSLTTQYVPPGGPQMDEDPYGGGYPQPRGGGGGGAGASGEGLDMGAPIDEGGAGRITVTLEISTTRKDATRFVRDTVVEWLWEHSERDGVPYIIDTETIDTPPPLTRVIPLPGEDPMQPGGETVGSGRQEPGSGRGVPPPRGPGRGDGRGGHSGGGHGAPTGTGGGEPLPENLDQLAPLPAPEPEAEPGSTISSFTITWEVQVKSSQAQEVQS